MHTCVVVFCVHSFEASGCCSFCWYWCNCWLSLLKRCFHIIIILIFTCLNSLRRFLVIARLVTLVFISDTMLPYKNKLKGSTMTFLKTKNKKSWNIKTVNIFPIALFCMYCRWRFSFQEEIIGNSLNRLINCVPVLGHGRVFGCFLCLGTWDKRRLFVSLVKLLTTTV